MSNVNNIMQSIISENSQEVQNDCDSETFEKVQIERTGEVADSIDNLFKEDRTSRQSKKIFTIGEKRITSEVSSSGSRERELVKKTKNALFLKNKELKDKNSARKSKNATMVHNFNKKYSGKLEKGKVSLRNYNLLTSHLEAS